MERTAIVCRACFSLHYLSKLLLGPVLAKLICSVLALVLPSSPCCQRHSVTSLATWGSFFPLHPPYGHAGVLERLEEGKSCALDTRLLSGQWISTAQNQEWGDSKAELTGSCALAQKGFKASSASAGATWCPNLKATWCFAQSLS